MVGVAHASIPAYGTVNGTALTGSYATVLALSYDADIVQVFNSCNDTIILSGDDGVTDQWLLPAGRSFVLDFRTNEEAFPKGTFKVKHNGAAPTSGLISITVMYRL